MSVVVPFKFDKRGVNIAGIHYRIHSIGIEGLLKALRGTLTKITKKTKMIFVLFYIFQMLLPISRDLMALEVTPQDPLIFLSVSQVVTV